MTTNASTMKENSIRTSDVSAAEQRRRIDQAIARRANKIFESRGAAGCHELEDWRQAESEVRSNFCFGLTTSSDAVLVGFDSCAFETDSIELWVAPRQITVSGKPLRLKDAAAGVTPAYQEAVFRVIVLPAVIDPRGVVMNWNSGFIEIHLPFVQTRREVQARAPVV